MAVDFPKRVVHGGIGKLQQEKTKETVLDFSASVNPYPPAVSWHCDITRLAAYPDDTYSALKERIASEFSRSPDEICVGNGSVEIIRVFCSVTLGRSGKSRLFSVGSPTFGEYELSALLAGGEKTARLKHAGVRFICNPNNPDGALLTRQHMLEMLGDMESCKGMLFVDEAFAGLADSDESLANIRNPSLFVLHSLTKTFAVPGLRIGFGFGDTDLVEKIETARSPWCVNAYAEAFALEALNHISELAGSRKKIQDERKKLVSALSKLGFGCHPSSANYLLVECGRDASPLCQELARHNVLVRDCTSFGLPTCIRIAVMKSEENRQLLEALAACVR